MHKVELFRFENDQLEPVIKKVVGKDKKGKDITVDIHKQVNVIARGETAARERAGLGPEYLLVRVFELSEGWQAYAH